MSRPKCTFKIAFCPKVREFNPRGARKCRIVAISGEEVEALRLKNLKGLDQTGAAKEMGVSQSTFQRILSSAYKKVSEALVEGKGIVIMGESQKSKTVRKK